MSRAKKYIRYGLLLLLVVVVVAYFVGDRLLNQMSREILATISKHTERHGLEIAEPQFQRAAIVGLRTARWTDISAKLRFPDSSNFEAARLFTLHIDQLEASLAGSNQVQLFIEGLEVDSTIPAAKRDEGDKGDDGDKGDKGDEGDVAGLADNYQHVLVPRLACPLDWQLFDPAASLKKILPEIVALVTSGAARIPVEAEGTLQFVLKGQPTTLRLKVEENAGDHCLALEGADVEKLSELFDEELTAPEVALVASHPLRAPELLRAKDDAESTAKSAAAKDTLVPQDAYRHVLWCYLLSKRYGAKFAEEVTDAHEQGDTGNTAAERDMDLHNNQIGRQYAAQKLKRPQILPQVLKDPDVIRQPQ